MKIFQSNKLVFLSSGSLRSLRYKNNLIRIRVWRKPSLHEKLGNWKEQVITNKLPKMLKETTPKIIRARSSISTNRENNMLNLLKSWRSSKKIIILLSNMTVDDQLDKVIRRTNIRRNINRAKMINNKTLNIMLRIIQNFIKHKRGHFLGSNLDFSNTVEELDASITLCELV